MNVGTEKGKRMSEETRMNIAEVDLLPCPFCGGEPEIDHHEDEDGGNGDEFYIKCGENYCVFLSDATPEGVCNDWNRRDGKLLVEQVPEVVGKFRMAYHSTYIAINIFEEMRELSDWMAKVMKPENSDEYQTHISDKQTLKDLSYQLESLGWVRKEDEEKRKS